MLGFLLNQPKPQRARGLVFVPTTMVADKSKKLKVSEKGENAEEIDGELVLSIEKLQEIQDELEKVSNSLCLVLFVFSNSQI